MGKLSRFAVMHMIALHGVCYSGTKLQEAAYCT